ncbi:hypothetical protein BKA62DRAFT_782983 [Auriculariales sp. MPI-PUGE-AT-0066]|nr:hypothetical protein BKA62DRAFT_782983 [Auriculariales sp. MPI-PUGE-AT-0066]
MANTVEYDASAHDVRAVTVFQVDRAEVNRRIQVQLKAGQNDVVVTNLPTCLDEDSLRVDGIGSATVFDVIYSPPASNLRNSSVDEKLTELNRSRAAYYNEQQALQRQDQILDDYSKSVNAKDADSKTLGTFLDFYLERKRTVSDAILSTTQKLAAVDKEIREAHIAQRSDNESLKRAVKVTIVVLADEDGEAELALTYNVTGASWTPLYDVRAHVAGEGDPKDKADSHKVHLHYRASISQHSGESWNNVQLTLSTASPQLGSEIPTLYPHTICELAPPPLPRVAMTKGGGGMRALRRSAATEDAARPSSFGAPPAQMMAMAAMPQSAPPPPMMRLQSAAVTESAVSATFAIEGLSTIPSDSDTDSQTHKVSIAELPLSNVELEWISVPKEQENVFLQCKVKNTSNYPLLPGQASIYMGNSFVAKSSIQVSCRPQESFSASLGIDGAVRITYHPQAKNLKQPTGSLFAANKTSTTAFSQRITIRNARRTPLRRLVVRDQVPQSSDARIKVTIMDPKELPTGPGSAQGVLVSDGVRARHVQKNDESPAEGDAGNGLLEWVCTVQAGASIDLNLSYEVSAPVGLRWGR